MPPRRTMVPQRGMPPQPPAGGDHIDPRTRRERPTMETFDDGFEDDVDNEGFFDDPAATFTGDQSYNTAVSRAQLARTYYTQKLGNFISGSTLFPDTKETLRTFVNGLFDKTEVLAKTENLTLRLIDVQIMLAQARLSFHPMDVDNPDLTTVVNMINHHYDAYISRSVGGWERGLQNVMETSHRQVSVMENRPGFQQGGAQKRPWYRKLI